MSGETTSAGPRRPRLASDSTCSTTAGAWKHSDLPPPVGSTTTLSRDARTACIASRCSGRNAANPQTRWSVSSSSRSASGVGVLDVLIDQALERGGELVVGAAQSGHVLAVDVDGTVRSFAGPRQADADVRRLRLTGSVDDAAHHGERHRLDAVVGRLPLGHLLADVA